MGALLPPFSSSSLEGLGSLIYPGGLLDPPSLCNPQRRAVNLLQDLWKNNHMFVNIQEPQVRFLFYVINDFLRAGYCFYPIKGDGNCGLYTTLLYAYFMKLWRDNMFGLTFERDVRSFSPLVRLTFVITL